MVGDSKMKRKIFVLLFWFILSICAVVAIAISDKINCTLGSALAGALIAIFIEKTWKAVEDLSDTTDWKVSQRKLLRGRLIKKDTMIRISFAYLYRIKIGNDYLLIKNNRGTGKFQPVGGVYKLKNDERVVLNNLYHVVDDDKMKIDKSSRDDYRLQMPSRYLRDFVRRFDTDADRERIEDVSREFKEELGDYFDWDKIKYRYCGRHMTELKYGDHFQCYELLLADIVELMPTEKQLKDLKELKKKTKTFKFANAEKIKSLGVISGTDILGECIADHSMKVLQENEQYLMRVKGTGKVYEVVL